MTQHIIMQTCLFKLFDLYFRSTMSEELRAIATVIAVIPKRKSTERKKKEELLGGSFGYVEKFWVISNNFAKVLKAFLSHRNLYMICLSHPSRIRASAILQWKFHLLAIFYALPFLILKIFYTPRTSKSSACLPKIFH